MKPKRKRDFTGMFIMAVLLSFILPLGYLVVRIVSYGGGTEEVRSREDYVLMLLQCLLGIAAIVLPLRLIRQKTLQIPRVMLVLYIAFLYCAIFLGEVRSFYYAVPQWDTILHTMSGAMLGALGFSMIAIFNNAERIPLNLSPVFIAVFAFCFALALGAVWEIYEFTMDSVFGTNMQKYMLDNGTVMNGKMIESPKSFQVACTVMTQIIASVASSQYGGQSVDIRHLGKYLRKSYEKFKKSIKETSGGNIDDETLERLTNERLRYELKGGVQTIQYQINTLMTTNGQSPFVTLFLNLQKDDPYLKENAMIVEEILRQRLQGIKNDKGVYVTPAFPKLVYVLDEHNCLKGGKYDYITRLAVKCSAKRMYPDYISAKKMRENYEGNVFSPMGCRSFLSPWKDENGNYKFEGRFNQGVVSLNLPQIGIVAKGDEQKFWKLLDERLELCFEALMCRHNALKGIKSDVSPVHWQYGAIARLGKGETIDKYLENGYSTISLGYIGLYELTKLMKGVSHTDPAGEDFALRVMNRLRGACDKWKAQTGLGFGLYGTPAESLCYRFARIDKERFGTIEDVTDKGYYTNSYHVDVREKIDAFSKFKFESQFQNISSGGAISYVEIPNMRHNTEALEEVVKFIYDNIQYAEFNTKSDYCHVCGFDGEITINDDNEWECPACHNKDHSKMTVIRRTCGYLGENFWNVGKTKEIKARVMHL